MYTMALAQAMQMMVAVLQDQVWEACRGGVPLSQSLTGRYLQHLCPGWHGLKLQV